MTFAIIVLMVVIVVAFLATVKFALSTTNEDTHEEA